MSKKKEQRLKEHDIIEQLRGWAKSPVPCYGNPILMGENKARAIVMKIINQLP